MIFDYVTQGLVDLMFEPIKVALGCLTLWLIARWERVFGGHKENARTVPHQKTGAAHSVHEKWNELFDVVLDEQRRRTVGQIGHHG